MASEDFYDWWTVREGEFPDYFNDSCTDEKTYTVNIDDAPKRFIFVQGLGYWGEGMGLAFFRVSKV